MRIIIVPVIIRTGVAGGPTVEAAAALTASLEKQVLKAAEDAGAFRIPVPASPPLAAPAPPVRPAYESANPIAAFLADCCDIGSDRFACVADVYRTYKMWCSRNRDSYPLSCSAVRELLCEEGFECCRSRRVGGVQCRTYEGFALLSDLSLRGPGKVVLRNVDDIRAKLRRALAALDGEDGK